MTPTPAKVEHSEELPVLPVRDTVLFPHAVAPLPVGRESSVQLLKSLGLDDKMIAVVAQLDPRVERPSGADLHAVGTAGNKRTRLAGAPPSPPRAGAPARAPPAP